MNEFQLNGSDTSWLVFADYLEDNGIDATHIREGVAELQKNEWVCECCYHGVGVGFKDYSGVGVIGAVGGGFINSIGWPNVTIKDVGCYDQRNNGVGGGNYVGE